MDQCLKGRVSSLKVVNVFLVNAFTPMVGVGVVDAFCAIDRGTCSAAWSITIALERITVSAAGR